MQPQSTSRFHPAADLFPLLDESSSVFVDLVEDIRANGLLHPIVLFEGQILDGRNRLRACQLAGVEPRFETWSGTDPYHHVVSLNLHRRHLTDDQRSAIAMTVAPFIAKEVEVKRREQQARTQSEGAMQVDSPAQTSDRNRTRSQLAKDFGVSTDKIKQANVLATNRPDLLEEVKNGTSKLRDAVKQVPSRQRRRRPPPPPRTYKAMVEDTGLRDDLDALEQFAQELLGPKADAGVRLKIVDLYRKQHFTDQVRGFMLGAQAAFKDCGRTGR